MQLVVVTAVSAAVSAATITFATISQKRLFFISKIENSFSRRSAFVKAAKPSGKLKVERSEG